MSRPRCYERLASLSCDKKAESGTTPADPRACETDDTSPQRQNTCCVFSLIEAFALIQFVLWKQEQVTVRGKISICTDLANFMIELCMEMRKNIDLVFQKTSFDEAAKCLANVNNC